MSVSLGLPLPLPSYAPDVTAGESFWAGFGDPATNALVEQAAVFFVTQRLQSEGWAVQSVEEEKCGYDLLCRKGAVEKHVEVKGLSGKASQFVLTANEYKTAKADPDFMIAVVTSALTSQPACRFWHGGEFLANFTFESIAYRVVPKPGMSEEGHEALPNPLCADPASIYSTGEPCDGWPDKVMAKPAESQPRRRQREGRPFPAPTEASR